MLKQIKFLSVILFVSTILTACGSGIIGSKTAPDETRVVDGPSLSVPPDFELRPPQKGETYTIRSSRAKTKEAQSIITGGGTPSNTGATGEDSWLIDKAGGGADENIRRDLESAFEEEEVDDKKGFWKRQKENIFGTDEPEAVETK